MAGSDATAHTRRVRRARLACLLGASACALALVALPWPGSLPTGPGLLPTPDRDFEHTVAIASFWGLGAIGLGLVALAALAGFWARPLTASLPELAIPSPGRGFVVAVLLIVAVAGLVRLPLAQGSLWWDEAWSVTRLIRGPVEPLAVDPTRAALEPRHWARTIWYWKKPTNHITYNMAGRASLDTWRAAGGLPPEAHSDLVFRLPALAAALLAVSLVALLGWRFGFPGAGLAAAALLALHPFAIRYSVEGRAYTFLMPLAMLAALAMHEALRTGRLRAWLAQGAATFAILWTHPFQLYFAFAFGVLGLVGAARAPAPRRDRLTLLYRHLASQTLAAFALVAVMGPALVQFAIWYDLEGHPLGPGVFPELWSRLAAGMPWHTSHVATPPGAWPSVTDLAARIPGLEVWVFGLVPILALAGLVRLFRRPGPAGAVALTTLLAVPLAIASAHLNEQIFYSRYMTFALPTLLLLIAMGAGSVGALAPGRWRRPVTIGATAAVVALLAATYLPQLRVVTTRPIAPLRDVAEYLRSQAGDDPLSVLRAGYGHGGGMPRLYDPWIRDVHSRAEIEALCAEADAKGVPLFLFYGHPAYNRDRRGDGFELLDDPRHFAPDRRFDAVEPRFVYRVLRYTGVAPTGAPGHTPRPRGGVGQ